MNKISLQKIEKVNEGKYLNKYELTYLNKNNKEKVFEIVSRNDIKTPSDIGTKIAGVSIFAIHKTTQKMLLLKEFRMGVNREIINTVSGMLESNESITDCVKRELYEETGLQDVTIKQILKPAFISAGMSDDKICVVFAEVDGTFEDNSSENEQIIPKFYSKEEVKKLLETHEFASNTQTVCSIWAYGF